MVIEETPCGLQTREIDVQFDLQYQNNNLRILHVVRVDRPPPPLLRSMPKREKIQRKGKDEGERKHG